MANFGVLHCLYEQDTLQAECGRVIDFLISTSEGSESAKPKIKTQNQDGFDRRR